MLLDVSGDDPVVESRNVLGGAPVIKQRGVATGIAISVAGVVEAIMDEAILERLRASITSPTVFSSARTHRPNETKMSDSGRGGAWFGGKGFSVSVCEFGFYGVVGRGIVHLCRCSTAGTAVCHDRRDACLSDQFFRFQLFSVLQITAITGVSCEIYSS